MRLPSILFLPLTLLAALTGCVCDKPWQLVPSTATLPPEVQPKTTKLSYRGENQASVFSIDRNHATVEFLESGELADNLCRTQPASPLCQRNYAVSFIQQGRILAAAKTRELTVLTFIHGNENNASEKSDNYPHFRQLIDCLNRGEQEYRNEHREELLDTLQPKLKPDPLPCWGVPPPGNKLYIGVYIGWRGNRTGTKANLRQKTAMRISSAKESQVKDTLYKLRDAAKQSQICTEPARFVVLGHSFGGLILEQAAKRIYTDAFQTPATAKRMSCSEDENAPKGLAPFTDLVVLINPAINGKPSQEFITMLRQTDQAFSGKAFCSSSQLAGALVRPYVLNIVSKTDFWSRPYRGNALRHYFGAERAWRKPDQIQDWRNDKNDEEIPAPRTVYHAAPANILAFQNLCYLSETLNTGDENVCDEVLADKLGQPTINRESLAMPGTAIDPPSIANMDTERRKTFNPWNHLFVRYNCKPVSVARTNDDRPRCAGRPAGSVQSDLHIWNNTPYWLAAIDGDVINGHNDFWNGSFARLVLGLEEAFPVLGPEAVIPTPQ